MSCMCFRGHTCVHGDIVHLNSIEKHLLLLEERESFSFHGPISPCMEVLFLAIR
jgi:hypothetical protein